MTRSTPNPRPFKVLGLQQVAVGGTSKARLRALWVDLLGLPCLGSFRSEAENVDEDICVLGLGPFKVELDLMVAIDAQAKSAVHNTPLNHVGLWVDDLPQAVAWLTAQGVRLAPGGMRPGASGSDICFVHPKGNAEFPLSGEGVLIELVQAPPEVIAAYANPLLGSTT
jgi:lactoylglutathione lyase